MTIESISSLPVKQVENQSVTSPAKSRIAAAIKHASDATGVDFTYLMNKAAQESGMRADAKASTSSATGLFQFIEQTWLQMVKNHGAKHGLGEVADKVITTASGAVSISDRALRREVLELRKNPELSAAMAAELANENKQQLQKTVGGKIGKTELYMAHFLGPNAAAKFIDANRSAPGTDAASLLPEAAQANKGVFYNADGSHRTVGAIYKRFAGVMNRTPVIAETGSMVAAAASAPSIRLAGLDGFATESAGALQSFRPHAERPLYSLPSADPQSLLSTMMLAQLDMPSETTAHLNLFGEDKEDRGQRGEDRRKLA
ncbi:MAG: hypothetical protein GC131_00995 [Alphaproteobacteria bacterium]|nr:hypothetical protein [Alphaproteobacteria bacterium]